MLSALSEAEKDFPSSCGKNTPGVMAVTVDQMSYLLAFVSAIATLAGLGFAWVGYINLKAVDQAVERKLRAHVQSMQEELQERSTRAMEAQQKIIAAYGLSAQGKHEQAIQLLKAAVKVDPQAYNGYTTLGYEYMALGQGQEAIEAFHQAIRQFPQRPESYLDLARIYARLGNNALALEYIKETLDRQADLAQDIDADSVFDTLREQEPAKYAAVLGSYRR